MKIFKLRGKESVMNLHLDVPIHLDGEYKLALTGFYSDNNIANLKFAGQIQFSCEITKEGNINSTNQTFTLPKGYWTLDDIQEKCRTFLKECNANIDENKLIFGKSGDRITIKSPVKFKLNSALCELLGFKESSGDVDMCGKGFYPNDKVITGDHPPNLRAVDVIEIHCNLVEHSLVNHDTHWHKHDETEILYHFFHNVPHGYKISETPQEKFYVPIKKGLKTIRQIQIVIKDNENQLLVNEGVNNIVYLSLIK